MIFLEVLDRVGWTILGILAVTFILVCVIDALSDNDFDI